MHVHSRVYITTIHEKKGQEFEGEQGGVKGGLGGRKGKGENDVL